MSLAPLGGKVVLLSALCGQSMIRGPNCRKDAVISSAVGWNSEG